MENRKRRNLKFLSALLLTLACIMLLGTSVFATSVYKYKAVPLTAGKTATQKDRDYVDKNGNYTYTYYRYQVKVPSEGYLTMTVKNGKSDYGFPYLYMYDKLNDESSLEYWYTSNAKSLVIKIPVSKGTYFFSTETKQTLSYKFTKVTQKANYCRAKAMALKKKAKVTICQTPQYNFTRWFKLTLTKKQAITYWINWLNNNSWTPEVRLYDSKMKSVNVERAGSESPKYFTSEKQDKGTYYLCVRAQRDGGYIYNHRLLSLYWS